MPPEIEFHAELTSTLNSLRDLHTGYRLPAAVRHQGGVAAVPRRGGVGPRRAPATSSPSGCSTPGPIQRMDGARVTHWNGTPIDVGGRPQRRAHGRQQPRRSPRPRASSSLTVRPLATGLPPDEEWVDLRWVDDGGHGPRPPPGVVGVRAGRAGRSGRPARRDQRRRRRRSHRRDPAGPAGAVRPAVAAAGRAGGRRGAARRRSATPRRASSRSCRGSSGRWRCAARTRPTAARRTATSASSRSTSRALTAFVDEFARLAGLLPDDGLDHRRARQRRRPDLRRRAAAAAADPDADRAAAGAVRQHAAEPAHLPQAPPLDDDHRAGPRAVDRLDRAGDAHRRRRSPAGFPITVAGRRQPARPALPRARRARHRRPELLGDRHVRRRVPGPRHRPGDRGRRGDRRRRRQRLVARPAVRADGARRARRPGRRRSPPLPHGADLRVAVRRTTRVGPQAGQRARGPRRHAGGVVPDDAAATCWRATRT